MYSKLRCNMELQMSEERARCESIIENVCGKRKKKKKTIKKNEGKQKGKIYSVCLLAKEFGC